MGAWRAMSLPQQAEQWQADERWHLVASWRGVRARQWQLGPRKDSTWASRLLGVDQRAQLGVLFQESLVIVATDLEAPPLRPYTEGMRVHSGIGELRN